MIIITAMFKNWSIFIDRATIVIKCDMDFVLYPLDVQNCPVDFSSCKSSEMHLSRLKKNRNDKIRLIPISIQINIP